MFPIVNVIVVIFVVAAVVAIMLWIVLLVVLRPKLNLNRSQGLISTLVNTASNQVK